MEEEVPVMVGVQAPGFDLPPGWSPATMEDPLEEPSYPSGGGASSDGGVDAEPIDVSVTGGSSRTSMARVVRPLIGQAIAVACVLFHHVKNRQDLRNPAFLPGEEMPVDLSEPLARIAGRHIPGGSARNSDLWDGLEAGIIATGWAGEQLMLDAMWRQHAASTLPQGPESPAPAPGPVFTPAAAPAPAAAPPPAAAPEVRGNNEVADPTPSPVTSALAGVPTRR